MQELQKEINQTRKKRGFVMDPHQIFALLVEEVGEVSSELKRLWSPNYDDFSIERLRDEIADVQVCLIALANQFDIDIYSSVMDKFFNKDVDREWKSASAKKTPNK